MTRSAVKSWPPRWLTSVSKEQLAWGDGAHAAGWIEAVCRITEDSIAGKTGDPIHLRGWQRSLLAQVFARRRKYGRLKHRRGLIGIARKNGKTTLAAGMGLYGLLSDFPGGQQGREVYACAGDKDQAKLVFNTAKQMVEANPALADVTRLYRDAIEVPDTHSIFRVLSAEAYTKEGLNPTMVIFDEVHVQPNRELWDVMSLAFGARVDPLLLGITTAGVRYDQTDNDSICFQLYEYGKRVVSGEVDDPEFLFAWWEPYRVDASHLEERTWREANPGYDDIVSGEDFESSARNTPEGEFRTKRCNQWVMAKSAYLPAGSWDRVMRKRMIPEGASVVVGFDGSFNSDSTAIVVASVEAVPHMEVVMAWEKPEDADPGWKVAILEVEAWLRACCGRLDPTATTPELQALAARRWRVVELACDKFRWQRTFQILGPREEGGEGLPVVEFPQTGIYMTPATQRFYEAVTNEQITQSGDPALARHLDNAVLRRDSRGWRLTKEAPNSTRRIDLAVAALMAYARACWHVANKPVEEGFMAGYR